MRGLPLLVVMMGGCAQGPVGPTADEEVMAVALIWEGDMHMAAFAPPSVAWFIGDGCEARTGTPFLDGHCVGSASVNGDHRTGDASLPWTGSISSSGWCWAMVTISGGFRDPVVPIVENDDPAVTHCQAELVDADL